MTTTNETRNGGSITVASATIGARIKHFALVTLALVAAGAAGGSTYFFFGGFSRSAPPHESRIGPAVFFNGPIIRVNLSANGNDRPWER
jgi:hypothetical protein